jgi:molybdopterin-containing oxidoreductase family iron-sulfur binding subunit
MPVSATSACTAWPTACCLSALPTTCIGRAGYFGDENDSSSLIAQVKKANKVQILKAGKGTAPRVYYIALEKLEVLYA